MPVIGLGTFESSSGDAERAVKDAIDAGYRHIDTAFLFVILKYICLPFFCMSHFFLFFLDTEMKSKWETQFVLRSTKESSSEKTFS